MGNLLSKLSTEALKDHWRLSFHTDKETATAIDFELSERLGLALCAELGLSLESEAA
jgi:hypothetical protein